MTDAVGLSCLLLPDSAAWHCFHST